MFRRQVVASVLSMMLLSGLVAIEAAAGHTEGQAAEGIAVLLFLKKIWQEAASSANADRDDESYSYNHGLSARDNAVAACVHRAFKVLKKAGGVYLRLDKVKTVTHRGNNDFDVAITVTEVYVSRHKKKAVKCLVNHNLIKTYYSS